MAADSAPKGKMAQAIGTVQTAQRLGPALGPVVGGVVAALVGLRRAFFVASVFYLAAVVLVFVLYDEHQARPAHVTVDDIDRSITFRSLLAFENFLLMMAVIFGLQFVDRSFGPILPLYVGQLGISAAQIPLVSGILFSIAAGAGALGHHYCASLLRRHSPPRLIAAASAAAAVGAGLYVVVHDVRWLFLATPVFGIAIGSGMTAAYTSAASVIPASARGAGFGLLTTASLVGLAVSPIVSGLLGATSIRAVFGLDVVALAALAVVVVRVTGRGSGVRRRRTPHRRQGRLGGTRRLGNVVGRTDMSTVIVVDSARVEEGLLREPARLLREGRVVAFPTDTLVRIGGGPTERGSRPAPVRVEGTRGRLCASSHRGRSRAS